MLPSDHLRQAFRHPNWRLRVPAAEPGPDLIVQTASAGASPTRLAVLHKHLAEGRKDRLIPLLAQAILEAQHYAAQMHPPALPVAVVSAPRITPAVSAALHDFAHQFAPRSESASAIGVLDFHGLRAFSGHGLEVLNAHPRTKRQPLPARPKRSVQLFSGLNPWLLKVLLAPLLPESQLRAPRGHYQNPSELATAAAVSPMSAYRLVRQLETESFLDRGYSPLELVRLPELLRQWAAQRPLFQDYPVRWILKQSPAALSSSLREYARHRRPRQPQACLGLFAAAEALGFGFVSGVPPHIYLERLDPQVLPSLNLTLANEGHPPDAVIRIPFAQPAIFRAAVLCDGVPCADILQTWLDVQHHPSRGQAQADLIARRALKPLLRERN